MLFHYPKPTLVDQFIAKNKLFKKNQTDLRGFSSQVEKVTWWFKLAPKTLNIPVVENTKSYCVQEIQIIKLELKNQTLNEKYLMAIDKGIPSPLIFELHVTNGNTHLVQVKACFKFALEDGLKNHLKQYYQSDWLHQTTRAELPLATNMNNLYERLLMPLLPFNKTIDETLPQYVLRITLMKKVESQIKKLEKQLINEKQFNRKVELNQQLREIKQEFDA
ncbi:MAG: DUF4391 domain-containing protein [Saccharospirillaceae bacterium]|nr:DUF4391 domain-containing protein [Pseudomonadales bacterium]NRB80374.1 DUF4391 domain-containing protein [Saccharospirillaceae bacterium]